MKAILISTLLLFVSIISFAQKPKDGTYTYSIAFEEWQGKSLGATCTVIIKGDSIKVVHNGKGNLTGNKGDIIDEGILMKHKSGKWIIGHNSKDKNADEIGGYSDGPRVIDFKQKKFGAVENCLQQSVCCYAGRRSINRLQIAISFSSGLTLNFEL